LYFKSNPDNTILVEVYMNKTYLILGILSSLVSAYTNLPQDTLKSWLQSAPPFEFVLIDVRGPQDNITQVIGNDRCKPYNLAWPTPFTEVCTQLKQDQHIIIYCRSGSRAASASTYLANLGYTHVYNGGGVLQWIGPYLPVSDTLPASQLPQPSMKNIQSSNNVAIFTQKQSPHFSTTTTAYINFSGILRGSDQSNILINGQKMSTIPAMNSRGVSMYIMQKHRHP
jgi:rhodanese-related sulfurtransferase